MSGSNTRVSGSSRLLAHGVVLVDERRPAVAVDRHDDGEADGRLRRRDRHDHEGDHRGVDVELRHERAEGDDGRG